MGKFKDLTNQRFGRLVVKNIAFRKNNRIYWHCKCDCGNECDISGCHLTSGASQSCGCLRKEKISQLSKKDLTGQRFGKLLVIKEVGLSSDKKITWLCQCDCGNQKIIAGSSLRSGASKSCGCTKSYGEEKIISLLKENDLIFETEKAFKDCRYPDTNYQAKFDFFVNNEYLIEYDGKQHFGIGGWNNDNNFQIIQSHDKFKNEWCKKNNIPLIRIPYTHYNDLCLKDLLLETSEYII